MFQKLFKNIKIKIFSKNLCFNEGRIQSYGIVKGEVKNYWNYFFLAAFLVLCLIICCLKKTSSVTFITTFDINTSIRRNMFENR